MAVSAGRGAQEEVVTVVVAMAVAMAGAMEDAAVVAGG